MRARKIQSLGRCWVWSRGRSLLSSVPCHLSRPALLRHSATGKAVQFLRLQQRGTKHVTSATPGMGQCNARVCTQDKWTLVTSRKIAGLLDTHNTGLQVEICSQKYSDGLPGRCGSWTGSFCSSTRCRWWRGTPGRQALCSRRSKWTNLFLRRPTAGNAPGRASPAASSAPAGGDCLPEFLVVQLFTLGFLRVKSRVTKL